MSRGRRIAHGLMVLGVAALTGCRSEEAARARRLAGLRKDAQQGVVALDAFCAAREVALDSFAAGAAGWERALEELLRAPDAADDYCERAAQPHDHQVEGTRPPAVDTSAGR